MAKGIQGIPTLATQAERAAYREAYGHAVYKTALLLTHDPEQAAALAEKVFAKMERRFAHTALPDDNTMYLRAQVNLLFAQQEPRTANQPSDWENTAEPAPPVAATNSAQSDHPIPTATQPTTKRGGATETPVVSAREAQPSSLIQPIQQKPLRLQKPTQSVPPQPVFSQPQQPVQPAKEAQQSAIRGNTPANPAVATAQAQPPQTAQPSRPMPLHPQQSTQPMLPQPVFPQPVQPAQTAKAAQPSAIRGNTPANPAVAAAQAQPPQAAKAASPMPLHPQQSTQPMPPQPVLPQPQQPAQPAKTAQPSAVRGNTPASPAVAAAQAQPPQTAQPSRSVPLRPQQPTQSVPPQPVFSQPQQPVQPAKTVKSSVMQGNAPASPAVATAQAQPAQTAQPSRSVPLRPQQSTQPMPPQPVLPQPQQPAQPAKTAQPSAMRGNTPASPAVATAQAKPPQLSQPAQATPMPGTVTRHTLAQPVPHPSITAKPSASAARKPSPLEEYTEDEDEDWDFEYVDVPQNHEGMTSPVRVHNMAQKSPLYAILKLLNVGMLILFIGTGLYLLLLLSVVIGRW